MTVVLEPPLTGSYPVHGRPRNVALLTAPRYVRTAGMGRWHRPRSGQTLGFDGRTVYSLWCGQSVLDAAKALTTDTAPPGEAVCGTCEGRAVGAGQDTWAMPGGPNLIYSPHRLTIPKLCPGSRSERLYEDVGDRVVRCLACSELVPGRVSGGWCYSHYGPVNHAPGQALVPGCPFHAWRHLVRCEGQTVCSCVTEAVAQ